MVLAIKVNHNAFECANMFYCRCKISITNYDIIVTSNGFIVDVLIELNELVSSQDI